MKKPSWSSIWHVVKHLPSVVLYVAGAVEASGITVPGKAGTVVHIIASVESAVKQKQSAQ